MKAFITLKCSYSPLVWMFHSKRLGEKINTFHERALNITYGNKSSSFHELLEEGNNSSPS